MSAVGLPTIVKELVRVVGRAFYRDEFVLVLDTLTQQPFLREDELIDQFHLSKRQLTRILRALVDDGMIHDEDITEQARTRRIREEEAEELALARGADDVVVREQSGKSGSNGNSAAVAEEEQDDSSGYQREATIRTRCYYINPRWFVDMVSYRVFLMRKQMTSMEEQGIHAKLFECTRVECGKRFSMADAVMLGPEQNPAGEAGVKRDRREVVYVCPLDSYRLRRLGGWETVHASTELADKLEDQLQQSGILTLLRKAEKLPLGSNRPSDLILEGRISLRDRSTDLSMFGLDTATGGPGGRRGGSGSRLHTFRPGIYQLQEEEMDVVVEEPPSQETLDHRASAEDLRRAAEAEWERRKAKEAEMESALPEHLRYSSITGRKTRSLGFLSHDAAGAGGLDPSRKRRRRAHDLVTKDENDGWYVFWELVRSEGCVPPWVPVVCAEADRDIPSGAPEGLTLDKAMADEEESDGWEEDWAVKDHSPK